MNGRLSLLLILVLLAFGCESLRVNQTSSFIDGAGNIIDVEYGQGDEPYKTTFVSPVNGRKMELESKLRVRVTMPDGQQFIGYQCMHMLASGTMYKSKNGKYMFHANGFSASVFEYEPERDDYRMIYEGAVIRFMDKEGH